LVEEEIQDLSGTRGDLVRMVAGAEAFVHDAGTRFRLGHRLGALRRRLTPCSTRTSIAGSFRGDHCRRVTCGGQQAHPAGYLACAQGVRPQTPPRRQRLFVRHRKIRCTDSRAAKTRACHASLLTTNHPSTTSRVAAAALICGIVGPDIPPRDRWRCVSDVFPTAPCPVCDSPGADAVPRRRRSPALPRAIVAPAEVGVIDTRGPERGTGCGHLLPGPVDQRHREGLGDGAVRVWSAPDAKA